MRTHKGNKREDGIVIIAVFVLVILGVILGAFLFVKRAADKKPVSTTAAEVVEAGGSALSRNAQNTVRKNDSSVLLSAVADYQGNNSGQMPTEITSSMLRGMGYYTTVTLAEGEQAPITTDEMRLVTGARCLTTGATAVGTTTRRHAVQYSLKNDDGSFDPVCRDG